VYYETYGTIKYCDLVRVARRQTEHAERQLLRDSSQSKGVNSARTTVKWEDMKGGDKWGNFLHGDIALLSYAISTTTLAPELENFEIRSPKGEPYIIHNVRVYRLNESEIGLRVDQPTRLESKKYSDIIIPRGDYKIASAALLKALRSEIFTHDFVTG
jgi:hypothetical protein